MTESTDVDDSDDVAYAGMPPLDVEKYRQYVDDFDITEERKIELLRTLWEITYSFVLLGFGADTVSRCIPALREISFDEESDTVEQIDNIREFNGAAQEKDN